MKKSKSWDMSFHWLRDKEAQKHFNIVWKKGKEDYADYFTKHHITSHHRRMRPVYVRDALNNIFYNIYKLEKIQFKHA